ncbi:MAG: acyl--CoA ligase [Gammaproteobacteria bacterium]|nr:acyl--CoA ligase [Gammaproteobacteria bacterium]
MAIRFHDRQINYESLWTEVERVAAWLHGHGIGAGDRVGLSMAEHPLHLIAHFAVARISAVIVPMDHRWTDSEKQSAVSAFDVKLVVDDATPIADADRADLPDICEKDSDLLISLSSGTTGKPKGALVTHRNLYERFVSQWKAIGYGENDCFAVLTPFYFGAGRSFSMSLLAAGGSVLIAPPPMKPPQIIQTLQQDFVTASFLPPTLLRRLFDFHNGKNPLLENLDYLIVSGEPLYADEALLVLEKICANLYSYYASSEGGGISVLRAEDFAEHAATVGKPTYKTDVEIVDTDNNTVADGIVGRLRYRGPGVATRYLDANGIEQQAGIGGWFYPGDLAERLKSGHIALRGRDKDVIIRGGVNIYPSEVEAVLLQHNGIDEVAVIGIDDADRGQIIKAFVAGNVDASELPEWCRDRLAPYKIPQQFRQLVDLPKRSSGKVDKQALLNQS